MVDGEVPDVGERVRAERQADWQELKVRCPALAAFLMEVAQEFGRPEELRVVLRDWTVRVEHGKR